ncbi:BQ2448_4994 [Microbotryum intermedium]|uniref:Protein HIR n=1 Tax=Microbotryum intermedium TaxID=269621 RepID=A0A238FEP2_9BASI|nr:BQ2448_4994 [Microbotryum intermedium]
MPISIIKPSWVIHPDETRTDGRPTTIYTLSIHPDRSRLATGGLDTKIRVWSTLGVVDPNAEKDERCPKLLSTLMSHSGVVMCVRWSHDGRYLASGSDDKIVMLWSLEQGKGGKVWGTDQVNIENWKAVRRLVGHDSDVAGVAWSPNDEYLASVGLDSTVYVYGANTFERIARLDGHMGFVKGVVFDPVGQYLATQSDDGSAKIWRTSDWRLQTSIEDVFVQAPKTNINRPSWSPDGAHLVLPNATSNDVFVAAVIDRSNFRGQTFMVGHGNIVECSAFNPHVFLRDPTLPPESNNFCSVLALCARSTLSLWITSKSEPVVVFEEIFERDILDLSWSQDGRQLWTCSSEGHVAVFEFDLDEIARVCPVEAKERFWRELYGQNVPSLEGAAALAAQRRMTINTSVPTTSATIRLTTGSVPSVNTLVARKGPGAKRVVPRNVSVPQGGNPFASAPVMQAPLGGHQMMMQPTQAPHPARGPLPHRAVLQHGSMQGTSTTTTTAWPQPPQLPQQQSQIIQQRQGPAPTAYTYVLPNQLQPHYASYTAPFPNQGSTRMVDPMAMEVDYVDTGARSRPTPGYGDHSRLSEAGYRTHGRTVGGQRRKVESEALRELRPAYASPVGDRRWTFGISNRAIEKVEAERALAIPAIKTFGSLTITDEVETNDTLAFRNFGEGERQGSSEVCVVVSSNPNAKGKEDEREKTLWIDYLTSYIVLATGSPVFSAVSLDEGSLIVYSPTGRRLWPVVVLDAPCAFLHAEGRYLMTITARGSLTVWDVTKRIAKLKTTSVETLLTSTSFRGGNKKGIDNQTTTTTITTSALLPNGTPILALSSGVTCSFDVGLGVWVRVGEKGWAQGSELWDGPMMTTKEEEDRDGPVGRVERAIREVVEVEKERGPTKAEDESEADADEEEEVERSIAPDSEEERRPRKKRKAAAVDLNASQTQAGAPLSGEPSIPLGKPEDFTLSRTLAHAEARIEAGIALDSSEEYRMFLREYCERLGKAGVVGRAEEVVRELMGPIYYKPPTTSSDSEPIWNPKVLEFNKRDVLRDIVLPELAKHEACTTLVKEFKELLKKVEE